MMSAVHNTVVGNEARYCRMSELWTPRRLCDAPPRIEVTTALRLSVDDIIGTCCTCARPVVAQDRKAQVEQIESGIGATASFLPSKAW